MERGGGVFDKVGFPCLGLEGDASLRVCLFRRAVDVYGGRFPWVGEGHGAAVLALDGDVLHRAFTMFGAYKEAALRKEGEGSRKGFAGGNRGEDAEHAVIALQEHFVHGEDVVAVAFQHAITVGGEAARVGLVACADDSAWQERHSTNAPTVPSATSVAGGSCGEGGLRRDQGLGRLQGRFLYARGYHDRRH